jgi:hypothetical protein
MAAAVEGCMSSEQMSSVGSADCIEEPNSIVEVSFGTLPKIHRGESGKGCLLHAALASHHERSTRPGIHH